ELRNRRRPGVTGIVRLYVPPRAWAQRKPLAWRRPGHLESDDSIDVGRTELQARLREHHELSVPDDRAERQSGEHALRLLARRATVRRSGPRSRRDPLERRRVQSGTPVSHLLVCASDVSGRFAGEAVLQRRSVRSAESAATDGAYRRPIHLPPDRLERQR